VFELPAVPGVQFLNGSPRRFKLRGCRKITFTK
jgi:hypothetical protein